MVKSLSRALLRSSSLIILISSSVTLSSAAFAIDPLKVVVTADRSEVPLKNTGSAITVITSEEIEKYGSKNIADVLRTVPGVTVAEAGGLGAASKISLRGASPGASMVLLDGIRIGDPSNTEGFLDFGNFSTANIERIEILRGPQSALYGSDAMGGVINIITKKGKRTPVREVTLEGGSYGTISARGSMSGATDQVSYSFGVNALHSDGFPRYGYRVDRDLGLPPMPQSDPTNKAGLSGNILYKLNDGMSVEAGITYFYNKIQFDNTYADNPYSPKNQSRADMLTGFSRIKFDSFGSLLKSQVSVFGNQIKRVTDEDYQTFINHSEFEGQRFGVEYQGDINSGKLGKITFGIRSEEELASDTYGFSGNQITNSIFLQDRFAIGERIDISVGGRIDQVEGGDTFETWRSAIAYRLDETQTKLRASIGTGAKLPTLYQQLAGYAAASLLPEESYGYDFGFDQSLAQGLVTVSATYFNTDYRNRIAFGLLDTNCTNYVIDGYGCYYNLGFVASHGVELAIDAVIIPNSWSARLSYTHTIAVNQSADILDPGAGLQIYRVPEDQYVLSAIYTGITNFEFEPRMTYVSKRLDVDPDTFLNVTIPAYFKFDFLTRYKLNDQNDAYIRFENLTDAHTEDVYNYGSAGRSVYVGWTTRW